MNDQNSSIVLMEDANNNQSENSNGANRSQRLFNVFSDLTNNQNSAHENESEDDAIEYTNENEENEQPQNDDIEDSYAEFRHKIPRLGSHSDVKAAAAAGSTSNKDAANDSTCGEEEVCSICLEPWTNSGTHRLVCLKCGHLFGEACIDKWLKSNQKCPQCNRPSKRADIRRLYSKSIKVIDTAELDKALRDIETERQLRKKAEIEASELKLRFQLLRDELTAEKEKHKHLMEKFHLIQQSGGASFDFSLLGSNSSGMAQASCGGDRPILSYSLEKMINLTENAGCRVVTFSPRQAAILASQPSNNPIFPGYGVKKISFLDYKISHYIPIHSKLIRDMCLNSKYEDEELLTGGLDKCLKLTNITHSRLIHSYECPFPVWSCCFNTDNPLYFYAGLANGHVLMFDKRKLDAHVQIMNQEYNNGSPVCNLNYASRDTQNMSFRSSGLLVAQLDKVSFFEYKKSEEYKYHTLLFESNIMSCHLEPTTRHLLVSTRPSQRYANVRHLVYEFQSRANESNETAHSLNLLQTFNGSSVQKLLARSKLFCLSNQLYGCAPCESTKSAMIWDVASNDLCAKLASTSDILDVCPIQYKEQSLLCTLTDKQLRVFRKN